MLNIEDVLAHGVLIDGEYEGGGCQLRAAEVEHALADLLEDQDLEGERFDFFGAVVAQHVEVSVEEVTGTVEGEVEAEGDEDVLLDSLDIVPGHRALLLACQIIVAIDHVLIVWKLGLL